MPMVHMQAPKSALCNVAIAAQVMPEMRQARAQVAAAPEVKAEVKAEPMDTLEGAGSVPTPIPNDIIAPVTASIAGPHHTEHSAQHFGQMSSNCIVMPSQQLPATADAPLYIAQTFRRAIGIHFHLHARG